MSTRNNDGEVAMPRGASPGGNTMEREWAAAGKRLVGVVESLVASLRLESHDSPRRTHQLLETAATVLEMQAAHIERLYATVERLLAAVQRVSEPVVEEAPEVRRPGHTRKYPDDYCDGNVKLDPATGFLVCERCGGVAQEVEASR